MYLYVHGLLHVLVIVLEVLIDKPSVEIYVTKFNI